MTQNYTVLARKYRPTTISELKGQDVLVTTLTNAFTTARIAHAFLLSGVRGIGKTTTARILAKALNCTGEDGNGNITLNPCNKCQNCTAINNDNHLDVLEMDAASKTGIDDIREIIETVKYRPSTARYKVYIIDEVHMLSKSAFNALLKTLEEPPPFVKFIFATTEIKKVPITIISRCQRFDLRRLTPLELQQHLAVLCNKEGISFEDNALLLIANAAEGSVRDSLSILDQAINSSAGNITENTVIELLGKGSKEDIYTLFTALTNNNGQEALNILNKLYYNGIEVTAIFEELLETCHLVTMLKTTIPLAVLNSFNITNPNSKADLSHILQNLYLTAKEEDYALTLAQKLSLNGLVILWQLLTKGIEELKISLLPKKAAEMLIVRIAWVNEIATLPVLNNLLNKEGTSLLENTRTAAVNNDNITKQANLNNIGISNGQNFTKPPILTATTDNEVPLPSKKDQELTTPPAVNPTTITEQSVKQAIEEPTKSTATTDHTSIANLENTIKEKPAGNKVSHTNTDSLVAEETMAKKILPEKELATRNQPEIFKEESNTNNPTAKTINQSLNDNQENNQEASMEEILELFPNSKPFGEKN